MSIPIEGWREALERFNRELIERTGSVASLRPMVTLIGTLTDENDYNELSMLHIENKARGITRNPVYLQISDTDLLERIAFLRRKALQTMNSKIE